jgi:hypothetical protein
MTSRRNNFKSDFKTHWGLEEWRGAQDPMQLNQQATLV